MMVWLGAALFVAVAIALFAARVPLARGQALVVGGRIVPGCVIAEAVVFLLLALLIVIFRDLLA